MTPLKLIIYTKMGYLGTIFCLGIITWKWKVFSWISLWKHKYFGKYFGVLIFGLQRYYQFMKKIRDQKSHASVPLSRCNQKSGCIKILLYAGLFFLNYYEKQTRFLFQFIHAFYSAVLYFFMVRKPEQRG